MPRHLDLDALLAQCRSGRGAIVVVEGERDEDDAWFYNRWFAVLGPQVTFHPQNGHLRVEAAVQHLRDALPHRRVFGLVDQDHRGLGGDLKLPDGVSAITRFTLENYLLDPEGWSQVIALERRSSAAGLREEVERAIEQSLRAAVPTAVYNQVLFQSGLGARLLTNIGALPRDPREELRQRPGGEALVARYEQGVRDLAEASVERLHRHVSGKLVLPELDRRLGLRGRWNPLLGYYIQAYSEPPADLDAHIRGLLSLPRS